MTARAAVSTPVGSILLSLFIGAMGALSLLVLLVSIAQAEPVIEPMPCSSAAPLLGIDAQALAATYLLPYWGAALGALGASEAVRRFVPAFRFAPKGSLSPAQQLALEGIAAAVAFGSGFALQPVASGLYGSLLTGGVVVLITIANFHGWKRVVRLRGSVS